MYNTNIESLKKQLNKCMEVVEATFHNYHLQMLGFGFCGIHQDNGWLQLKIEVSTEPGEQLQEDVYIKVNFYDEDNTIIYSYFGCLIAEEFSGYDTIGICCNEDNLAYNTAKCRMFVTRG